MRRGVLALAVVLSACGSTTASATSGSSTRSATSGSTTATATSGSPTPAPARCGPARAHSLAGNSLVRVYASGGFVYGCSVRTHRTTRLGRSNRCIAASRAGPAAVAAELTGYGLERCGVDTGTGEVIVRRLSDGRVLRTLDATQGLLRPESYQTVLSVVIKPDGGVAWTARTSSLGGGQAQLEVLAADAGSGARLLDSGARVAPASLSLHDSRLTWKDDGQIRSATLR
jgi:hypothetical protein